MFPMSLDVQTHPQQGILTQSSVVGSVEMEIETVNMVSHLPISEE